MDSLGFFFFFFNDTATTEIYTLSLHDALPIQAARDVFERSLRQLGAGFGDIRRFLVTHVHRDHYSMAAQLGEEYGADVALGAPEKASLDLLNDHSRPRQETPFFASLVSAGAAELAEQWNQVENAVPNQTVWQYPDTWLEG